MDSEVDLRETPAADVRDRLFEALDEASEALDEAFEGLDGAEGAVSVVADENVEAHLLRYQVGNEVGLDRDYAEVGPDTWELSATVRALEADLPAFDARTLPPQQRHETLTRAFDELAPEEGFVLVNDHDPKPLYHELRSTHGDVVDWEYRSEDRGEWRVAIRRTGESEAAAEDVVTRFDVREIPKHERHPTIHHRYGMLPAGGTLELIAPHEPRPLQREFRARYGDAFDWQVVEQEPGRVRVHVTREVDVDDAAESDDAAGSTGAGGHTCGAHSEANAGAAPQDGERDATADVADLEVIEELDVRDRPPAQRHEAIFEAYADLEGGEGFVLVNDHDPKPLYHQFDAEAGPAFRWSYQARDPGEWRVLIGKADVDGAAEQTGSPSEAPF